MEHTTQIIDRLRSKGLFREFLSGIVSKYYPQCFLTSDIPESTKERYFNFLEATQLAPDLLRIDWTEYDIIMIFLIDVIMMNQKPIDLWLSLAKIINGYDSAAIINEKFMDISLKRSVKTYLLKIMVGNDYSLYFFILINTEDLKDALIIYYVEADMIDFSKAQEKARLPLLQKDKSLRELEMNNLREKLWLRRLNKLLLRNRRGRTESMKREWLLLNSESRKR